MIEVRIYIGNAARANAARANAARANAARCHCPGHTDADPCVRTDMLLHKLPLQ